MIFTPFEPKVSFRFMLFIAGIPHYLCKTATMPSIENGEIAIDYINTDFYVKGKSRWNTIDVTLYDPVSPSAAALVHDWLLDHHNSSTGIDGYAFTGYKKDLLLQALDPETAPVESWTLYGAFATSVSWGDMDWTAEDAKEISLTLRYDYAVLG
jgi:hypothetical protein